MSALGFIWLVLIMFSIILVIYIVVGQVSLSRRLKTEDRARAIVVNRDSSNAATAVYTIPSNAHNASRPRNGLTGSLPPSYDQVIIGVNVSPMTCMPSASNGFPPVVNNNNNNNNNNNAVASKT